MPVSQAYQAVLVPERAIGTDQTKKTVIVVGADRIPQVREVKTGTLIGGMRVVQGSIKPGDNVIVDGVQRVFPGMPVAATVLAADDQGMPIFPPPPAPNRAPGKAEPSKKG
jgi:multidrug efflux system membrane fusion protein